LSTGSTISDSRNSGCRSQACLLDGEIELVDCHVDARPDLLIDDFDPGDLRAQLRQQRVEVDPGVRQQAAHGRHVHVVALGDVGERLVDLLILHRDAEALGFLEL
jgi:hypothetical protein